jgi:hypothetical protein
MYNVSTKPAKFLKPKGFAEELQAVLDELKVPPREP